MVARLSSSDAFDAAAQGFDVSAQGLIAEVLASDPIAQRWDSEAIDRVGRVLVGVGGRITRSSAPRCWGTAAGRLALDEGRVGFAGEVPGFWSAPILRRTYPEGLSAPIGERAIVVYS